MTSKLHETNLGAYVMETPKFRLDGLTINDEKLEYGDEQRKMLWRFFVFIRLPVVKGEKEQPPVEGTRVAIDPDTSNQGYAKHVCDPPEVQWTGVVITRPQSVHDALGTDFCILAYQPRGAPQPRKIAKFNELKNLKDNAMWRVWLKVDVNHDAGLRELKAIRKFENFGTDIGAPGQALRRAYFFPKME